MGALDGIRVVEMAQIWAGPGTGMYLADQGANVVKIEPLWGDEGRRVFTQPPIVGGESRAFLALNRNKRGLALDISHSEGQEIVYRLLAGADVFIHNFRPGVERRLGYDYDTLSQRNPRLIYVGVSAFGPRGPYAQRRGYDLLFQSLSGILAKRRTGEGVPIPSGIWISDASAPIAAAYGVTLALLTRETTGRGQRVETSLLHMALAMQSVDLVRVEHEGDSEGPPDYSSQAMYSPYRCGDGRYLIMVVLTNEQFASLCRALELEHLIDDPEYGDGLKRAKRSQELYELISGVLETKPLEYWLGIMERHDLPVVPVLEREEVFVHPQIEANGMLATQENPLAGRVEMFSTPVRLSENPGSLRSPAPLLGQHTEEVLEELGYDDAGIQRLREQKVIG